MEIEDIKKEIEEFQKILSWQGPAELQVGVDEPMPCLDPQLKSLLYEFIEALPVCEVK